MEHLVQRQSGYYFRLNVPPDLKPIFRKNEIKRSLKTGSLTLAKERAFLLSGRPVGVKVVVIKNMIKQLFCYQDPNQPEIDHPG